MCLYPRLMYNPKYKANKKNGGEIPPIKDQRTTYVPVGCGVCIECKRQNARQWQLRLAEDIKEHTNGKFITLTFSDEGIKKIWDDDIKYEECLKRKKTKPKKQRKPIAELRGYDLDNGIATRAVRFFLERWRKEHKKSLRHWLVTEIGGNYTERIHIHGIVWCDDLKTVERIWQYGIVHKGKELQNGQIENYVNERTATYIVKYLTKVDEKHKAYKSIVLTSPGIGRNYINNPNSRLNEYNGKQTSETYRTTTGHKIALPIYWRNKIYTEEQREQLWIQKLDKQERWVCGEKIDVSQTEKHYNNLVRYHRQRTIQLGYHEPEFIWKQQAYEETRRNMLNGDRIQGKYKGGYPCKQP